MACAKEGDNCDFRFEIVACPSFFFLKRTRGRNKLSMSLSIKEREKKNRKREKEGREKREKTKNQVNFCLVDTISLPQLSQKKVALLPII